MARPHMSKWNLTVPIMPPIAVPINRIEKKKRRVSIFHRRKVGP